MPVDFRRFRSGGDKPPIVPRDVFNSLSGRAPGFGYLRDVQGQVLEAWYARRDERDLAIKMNTGTGKTVVGLLALRSSLNENVGPALYVAPDKFLAEQAASQAAILGIRTTDDPESISYQAGSEICITNIYALVNGLSKFGGPGNYRVDPLAIGSVVIDDAHACVRTVEEQTAVRIPSDHDAYSRMMRIFRSDLHAQSISQLSDLEASVPQALMRVPISAWVDKIEDVIGCLQEYREDDCLKFSLPFVKDIMPACQAIFSPQSLEIRPFCPPTNRVASLEQAKRCLYLTATLADDSVLVTHFGVSEDAAKSPITPSSAADVGDRLILSPRELDPRVSDETIRQVVKKLSVNHNVVVLVPSWRRSALWQDYADQVVGAEQIAVAVNALKSGHVGIVVFVNKYDGVDLPDDACRVLVIDGVPEAINNTERREAEILGGSDVLAYRKLQRIEQGMGRGVRSAEDYCVVLLLGASLATVLSKSRIRDRLGPATKAQLELSMDVSRELGLADLTGVVEQCLDRDEGWLEVSRECLAGISYAGGSTEPFQRFYREAFEAATTEQFELACDNLRNGIDSVEDDTTKGWLQEHLATYMLPHQSHSGTTDARRSGSTQPPGNEAIGRHCVSASFIDDSSSPAMPFNAKTSL
ncbi:MAG: DEAD/DEAH box helicase [Acidimicrobiaceae bacterium]|nr:DEAD/DEAH box helicase [Acidimicrobiaceae bacterium]